MRYNGHKKYALFIGRWQPFHNGHKYLIDKALEEGKNVCIALRETEISDKNPYSVSQRAEMIKRVYGDKVKIITLPDIESINIGRNVGYEINQVDPPEDITKISATNIRAGKEANLPAEVAEYIKSIKTTIWLTGLPCAGKTTLAKRIKEELDNRGYKTVHLDGDDVRGRLNEDLGFSLDDRKENLRRVAHVIKLFNESGNIAIASFVSPTNNLRKMVNDIIGNTKLIYIKCSLEECERRDTKGMYAKARKGEIKNFTGIDDPFEEPNNPDLIVDTENQDIETCVKLILDNFNL